MKSFTHLLTLTDDQRSAIIKTSLAAFGCTKQQLAAGYLRNAISMDKLAEKAALKGRHNGYTEADYSAAAASCRKTAELCARSV